MWRYIKATFPHRDKTGYIYHRISILIAYIEKATLENSCWFLQRCSSVANVCSRMLNGAFDNSIPHI